jgi:hypothetical protein
MKSNYKKLLFLYCMVNIILAATTISPQLKEITETQPTEGPGSYKILESNKLYQLKSREYVMKPLKITRWLMLILFLFFCSGCAVVTYTLTNEEKLYGKTNAENIPITTQSSVDHEFIEIGYVTTTQTDIEKAKATMRKQASEYGGNAIIDFKITVFRQFIFIIIIPVPVDNYICRGRIIKYI